LPVNYFQMGDNVWLGDAAFPPSDDLTDLVYYLTDSIGLSTQAVEGQTGLFFEYDPTDPSPTIGGKTLAADLDQGPYDQGPEVESRNDNLIFSTPVLTDDIKVKGRIKVHVFVSSDRPDTDFAFRLTEVYPDGRSIALGQIIQRMRFKLAYRFQ